MQNAFGDVASTVHQSLAACLRHDHDGVVYVDVEVVRDLHQLIPGLAPLHFVPRAVLDLKRRRARALDVALHAVGSLRISSRPRSEHDLA